MGLLDDAIREHLELKRRHGAAAEEVARQEAEALGPPRRGEFAVPAGEQVGGAPVGVVEDDAPDATYAPSADVEPVADAEPGFAGHPAPEPGLPEGAAPEPGFANRPGLEPAPPEGAAPEPGFADHGATGADVADRRAADADFADPRAASPRFVDSPPSAPDFADHRATGPRFADPGPDPLAPGPRGTRPIGATPPPTEEWLEEDDRASSASVPFADAPPPVSGARRLDPSAPPAAPHDEDVLEETPDFLSETPDHDRLWFEQKPPRDFDFDK